MISYKNTIRYKFMLIMDNIGGFLESSLLETGLIPKHYGVLLAIKEHPNITQSDLAGKLVIDRSTTGKLVDLLEEKSYLKRNKHSSDRRAHCLSLTSDGEVLVDKLWNIMKEAEYKALSNLTTEETDTFMFLLDKIIEK